MKRPDIKGQLLLGLTTLSIALLISCADDPEPDPCAEENPVTATFKIEETFQLPNLLPESWEFYDTDTVNTYYVMFTAIEENAEYEWQLGAETITDRTFTRSGFPRGVNIAVSLKVTKAPNLDCFSDDDGVDEVTRSFFVTENFICDTQVSGTFEGFDEVDENNSRILTFDPCYLKNPGHPVPDIIPRLINLVEGCDDTNLNNWKIRYKHLFFGPSTTIGCLSELGNATIFGEKGDSIMIKYSSGDLANRTNKIFIGVRKE